MITGIFVAKMGVVIGTSLFGGKLFGSIFKDGASKAIATYAGAATGAYIGIKTANNLHRMLENAKKEVSEDTEEEEIRVNG